MSLRDDLIAAKALIDTPEKWCKHTWATGPEGAEECFCAWGAVVRRYGHDPRAERPALTALSLAVPAEFVCGYGPGSPGRIINFNDDPSTTHADVMALFDRAIAAASPTPSIDMSKQGAKQ